jgi:DNA-binding transcriptional regulator YhcF (GntR family)
LKDLHSALRDYYHSTDPSLPPYVRVSYSVKAAMANGLLKPGDWLPSTRLLGELFNINPMTASKAMQDLNNSGLVLRERGKSYIMVDDAGDLAQAESESNFKESLSYLRNTMKHFKITKATLNEWLEEAKGE